MWRGLFTACLSTLFMLPPAAVGEGNVSVTLQDGNLVIRGDAAGNRISVQPVESEVCEEYTVCSPPLGETLINGARHPSCSESRRFCVPGGFDIVLGDGADTLNILPSTPAFLILSTGPGPDFMILHQLQVEDYLIVDTGTQRDFVEIDTPVVGGNVTVLLRGGADDLNLLRGTFADNVVIDGHKGRDDVLLTSTVFEDPTTVNLRDDDDRLEIDGLVFNAEATLNGGKGSGDVLEVHEDSVGSVRIRSFESIVRH